MQPQRQIGGPPSACTSHVALRVPVIWNLAQKPAASPTRCLCLVRNRAWARVTAGNTQTALEVSSSGSHAAYNEAAILVWVGTFKMSFLNRQIKKRSRARARVSCCCTVFSPGRIPVSAMTDTPGLPTRCPQPGPTGTLTAPTPLPLSICLALPLRLCPRPRPAAPKSSASAGGTCLRRLPRAPSPARLGPVLGAPLGACPTRGLLCLH